MLAIGYSQQKSGYVKIPIDMGANTKGVSDWYNTLTAKLNTKGIVCSIKQDGSKATLMAPYRTGVISQIRQIIMGTISEDLNPKDPQKKKESLLRPVLEKTVFYVRKD